MTQKSITLPSRIEMEGSSIVVRVRSLDSGKPIPKVKRDDKMASYRVVLRVDVGEDDVVRSRGEETLKALKEAEEDYLRAHVEQEIGWLEQSFSQVETQSVTRLHEPRRPLKKIKSSSRRLKS